MIPKKGNKTDRTVMMENCIKDYFENHLDVFLYPETRVSTGVVDLFGEMKSDEKIIDVIVVEIKQSASDFYSGHGLNFVGSSNYMAVPSELVGFSIVFLRDNNISSVGIIEVTDIGTVRIVTYPKMQTNAYLNVSVAKTFMDPPHLRKKIS